VFTSVRCRWASLAASLVSSAEAAEVSFEREYYDCRDCDPTGLLVVRAGAGEANRMIVAREEAGEIRVTDAGAPLVAGPGCTAVGQQRVDCPTSVPALMAFVFAGDGDDTFSSSLGVNVDGGRGNDRLVGSPFADALYGGRGRDVLRGEDGDDALEDGRRVTLSLPVGTFAPVRAERDVFDGGAGVDKLGYAGRRRGVVVDLAGRGRGAGARGEGDSLRRLEHVVGTDGDDRLFGDESANSLDGGAGDDLVVGRGGDDRLAGSTGSNRVRGDAGDDLIGGRLCVHQSTPGAAAGVVRRRARPRGAVVPKRLRRRRLRAGRHLRVLRRARVAAAADLAASAAGQHERVRRHRVLQRSHGGETGPLA
jgi:hypothetical protein